MYKDSRLPSLLKELNVSPIINAGGTKTTYGGTILSKETLEVMSEATNYFFNLKDLNKAIGNKIANENDAEAGIVTTGSASAMILAIAACIENANPNIKKRYGLEETLAISKREIIVQRIHYGDYTYNYQIGGGKIIETGTVNHSTIADIESAINENTVAITHLLGPRISEIGPSLSTVSTLAKKFNIPLILDAAAMLPPIENMKYFINEGADIVIFSGGKALRGPANTGICIGKNRLISKMIEMISPEFGIGRSMKISKENLMGLYFAYKTFKNEFSVNELPDLRKKAQSLFRNINKLPKFKYEIKEDIKDFTLPCVVITSELKNVNQIFSYIAEKMLNSEPKVFIQHFADIRSLVINPFSLHESEILTVVMKLNDQFLSCGNYEKF